MIKQIDYIDGDRHYSEADILEYKEYVVADIREVDKKGNLLYQEHVWFALDKLPFKLKDKDIEEILNPKEEIVG